MESAKPPLAFLPGKRDNLVQINQIRDARASLRGRLSTKKPLRSFSLW
jgi:hypothetical protein